MSDKKVALITGVTGQDGAYLAEFLLEKGYAVHGIKRRSSSFNTGRVEHLYEDPHVPEPRFVLHYGDLTDATNLIRIIQETQPDEIYNLAAQSHVQVSFETAEYTANADALGTLRLLEAIRLLKLVEKNTLLSGVDVGTLRQGSSRSAKRDHALLSALSLCGGQALRLLDHGQLSGSLRLHASNGILFNHESPIRGETFVTRKITRAVAAIHLGIQDRLYLGNLDAKRDWGHAREYVRGMWMMMQQPKPDDYVLATGETHSVRSFVEKAFRRIGVDLEWKGEGVDERGIDASDGRVLVEVDPRYFRPTEVDSSDRRSDQGVGEARLAARDEARRSHRRNDPRGSEDHGAGRAAGVRQQRLRSMSEAVYPLKGKRIWVAGHKGMVGSAVVRRLASRKLRGGHRRSARSRSDPSGRGRGLARDCPAGRDHHSGGQSRRHSRQ